MSCYLHQEENHQHSIYPCACDPREGHSSVQLPWLFLPVQTKQEKPDRAESEQNDLPITWRTPVFQKSRLPRGFDCSAVSPLPFKDAIHTLAEASTFPVFAISVVLDTETKRSLSQGGFCQSGCIWREKFCSRALSDKREHKEKHFVEKYQVCWGGSPFIFHPLGWFYYSVKAFYWISVVMMAV